MNGHLVLDRAGRACDLPATTTLAAAAAPAGPVTVEVEAGLARLRALQCEGAGRLPVEAVELAEGLAWSARLALLGVNRLGAARGSGETAVLEVVQAAARSLQTFLQVPQADRPVVVDVDPGAPAWGTVRTVGQELVAQLSILDRYLSGVVEAITAADIAALTDHGRRISVRFGGEFVPVPATVGAVAARVSSPWWTELPDLVWLVGGYAVLAAIVGMR